MTAKEFQKKQYSLWQYFDSVSAKNRKRGISGPFMIAVVGLINLSKKNRGLELIGTSMGELGIKLGFVNHEGEIRLTMWQNIRTQLEAEGMIQSKKTGQKKALYLDHSNVHVKSAKQIIGRPQ